MDSYEEFDLDTLECLDAKNGMYRDLVRYQYVDFAEGQYEEYFPCPWPCMVGFSQVGEELLGMDYSFEDYYADHFNHSLEKVRYNLYRYIGEYDYEYDYENDDDQVRYVFISKEEYAHDLGRFIVKKILSKFSVISDFYWITLKAWIC